MNAWFSSQEEREAWKRLRLAWEEEERRKLAQLREACLLRSLARTLSRAKRDGLNREVIETVFRKVLGAQSG